MNTFVPEEPKLVLLQDRAGTVLAQASNIPNLEVKVVHKMGEFNTEAAGKLFNSTAPVQVQQVLASKKH